ncbi:uncharacterized protein ISCGN_005752, partial [Ixodes scapularis]
LLIAQAALACPLSRQHDPADRSVTVPLSSLKTTQGHVSGITFLADNEDDGRNKRLVFDESTRSASTSTVAYEATKGLSERFAIRGQGSTHVCTMSNPLIFFTQLLIAQAALACPLSRQHDPADRSVTVPLSSLKTTQGHVSGITFLADNEDDGRNKRLVFDESTRSASTSTVAYEATKGLSERFAIRGQGSTHVCTMSNPLIFFTQLLIAQAALACPLSRQHDPADRSVTVPLSSLKTTQGHVSGITFLADNEDDGRNKRLVFDESTRSASTSTVAYEATKGLSERFAIRGQGSTHVCTMSNPLIFFTQLLIAQAALACPLSRQHDPADRSVTVPLSSLKTTQGHVSGITFLADNEDDGRNKRLVFDESTRSASTSTVAYEATKGLSERFAIRGQGSTHVCTMSNPLIFFTQ